MFKDLYNRFIRFIYQQEKDQYKGIALLDVFPKLLEGYTLVGYDPRLGMKLRINSYHDTHTELIQYMDDMLPYIRKGRVIPPEVVQLEESNRTVIFDDWLAYGSGHRSPDLVFRMIIARVEEFKIYLDKCSDDVLEMQGLRLRPLIDQLRVIIDFTETYTKEG